MLGNALTTAAPPKVCRNFRRGSFLATDKCGAYYTSSLTNMSIAAARKRYLEFVSLSLVLGLAAAIATPVFFGWLADEVLEGETRHFDDVTRAAVHTIASPTMTTTMRGVSFLGSTLFLTAAPIFVVLWFVLRKWGREAALLAITMIGASALNTTLKLAFKRPRPVPFFNLTPRSEEHTS